MTAPVPTDARCSTWELWLCGIAGHGYHDSHNPCPVRSTPHVCGIDLTATYSVDTYPGVAFRVLGPTWTTVELPATCELHDDTSDCDEDCTQEVETEEVASDTFVRAVMVGDDRVMDVDRDELTELAEGASCAECGQIGCTHDGRER